MSKLQLKSNIFYYLLIKFLINFFCYLVWYFWRKSKLSPLLINFLRGEFSTKINYISIYFIVLYISWKSQRPELSMNGCGFTSSADIANIYASCFWFLKILYSTILIFLRVRSCSLSLFYELWFRHFVT